MLVMVSRNLCATVRLLESLRLITHPAKMLPRLDRWHRLRSALDHLHDQAFGDLLLDGGTNHFDLSHTLLVEAVTRRDEDLGVALMCYSFDGFLVATDDHTDDAVGNCETVNKRRVGDGLKRIRLTDGDVVTACLHVLMMPLGVLLVRL